MPPAFREPDRRDTAAYRAFRRRIRDERPICEACCSAPSEIIAHRLQPLLGGGLMDETNVMALCVPCDRDFTRSNPAVRRRRQRKGTLCQN